MSISERPTTETSNYSNSFLLAAWEKHEKIAMHFNELILKIRIQALGALAAVVTVGGVLLKGFSPKSPMPWGLLTIVFAVLSLFWLAIWLLDFLYYNRLLQGAVRSIILLEDAINSGVEIEFNMSHKIRDAIEGTCKQPAYKGPWFFYSIVGVLLLLGTVISLIKWI